MNKTLKTVLAFASAAALLMTTGCNDASTSSVPIVNLPVSSQPDPASSTPGGDQPQGPSEGDQSGTESTDSPVGSTSNDNPAPPPNGGAHEQGGEMSGNILVCDDGRGIVLFGGDAGGGTVYANALNEVKEKVGNNVNVFSMIVPTAGSFYMPDVDITMASEWDAIQNVNKQFRGIYPIDAYTALAAHTDEEIYARTDHHWMQLGAYYAAQEFVKHALVDYWVDLEDYDRYEVSGYLGTLYGYSNENQTMYENPETFVYYVGPNDFSTFYMNPDDVDFTQNRMFIDQPVSSSYSIFMGGDKKVVHVKTDIRNNRKLLIVKDSYANALVPCLTGSFQEIWTVDMRYLDDMANFPHSISQIVKENDISDVLFCMDTFSAVGENAYHLPDIT